MNYLAVIQLIEHQENVMERKVIDQTPLVHDIISIQPDIKVTSPTNEPQSEDLGGYDVLSYNWHLVSKTSGNEAVVIQWHDQTWEGVRAA